MTLSFLLILLRDEWSIVYWRGWSKSCRCPDLFSRVLSSSPSFCYLLFHLSHGCSHEVDQIWTPLRSLKPNSVSSVLTRFTNQSNSCRRCRVSKARSLRSLVSAFSPFQFSSPDSIFRKVTFVLFWFQWLGVKNWKT